MAKARQGRRRIVVAVLGSDAKVTAKERRSIMRELRSGTRKPARRALRYSAKGDPLGR